MRSNFTPSLSILALAGSTDAGKHAAFADMARGVLSFVQHGTRNVLADTREALQTLKGAQAKRVLVMVESAYAAADAEFSAHKRRALDAAQPVAKRIVASVIAEYDTAETSAKAAKDAKAAETKAAKEKAAKALEKAAKSVEPAARVLTLADALDLVRAACVAGDTATQDAIIAICETFADVAVA